MPIYAYRCESCGFEKDVLQKMSDAPLTQCPECLNDTFRKQVTAAGFQLKGSGWYVTDFRGGSKGTSGQGAKAADDAKSGGGDKKGTGESKSTAQGDSSASTASSTAAASSTSDA
jgi:putative FmdB family regulatory protein